MPAPDQRRRLLLQAMLSTAAPLLPSAAALARVAEQAPDRTQSPSGMQAPGGAQVQKSPPGAEPTPAPGVAPTQAPGTALAQPADRTQAPAPDGTEAPTPTKPDGDQASDRPAALVRDRAGVPLASWQPGWLDIHHIATGRGNATLAILPDGTSLLIDAGASANGLDTSVPTHPNASRRAGEWIGRYVQRQLRAGGLSSLDYALATHLHPDHVGDVEAGSPLSRDGAYKLTGITDVAAIVDIGTLIDRGFPDYDYPSVLKAPFADNYRAFIKARLNAGKRVEQFKAGSASQIAARGHRPASLPFEVRNLAANGKVWSGQGEHTVDLFPPLATLPPADRPTENSCSTAIRIGYGQFSYFTGGDLTSYTEDGALPWRDVLGPAARAAGRASVATADHHGMFDGLNADVVRTLRPRAWVIQAWHLAHPDMLQMERMLSERLYSGPRDIFATNLMRENYLTIERLAKRMRSYDGHVVVRVPPGGAQFYIAVTDNGSETDKVKLVTGMYEA